MPTPHPNSESEEKLRKFLINELMEFGNSMQGDPYYTVEIDNINEHTLSNLISFIHSYTAEQVREARIDELRRFGALSGYDDYASDRISDLTAPEQEEGE